MSASPSAESLRRQRRGVIAALAIYAVGFGLFWPNALMVADEAHYVGQAVLFAHGQNTIDWRNPQTGALTPIHLSTYPVGTSLLQLPLVKLGGWRAGPLASLLCLIGAVLLLMRWLESAGRSPLFALLLLAYPPALIQGRVGMSDVPSAFVVLVGWSFFWAGLRGRQWAWFGSGLCAGLSVLWREPNVLFFLPLFVGAVVRRDRATWQLVVGGVIGLAARALSSWLVFGDALFYRSPSSYGFWTATTADNFKIYLFALLVMVPGGLLGLLLYRGERRIEVVTTGLIVFAFYTLYGYGGQESGLLKQLILGPRFLIPLVPLLAFALAESLPRMVPRTVGRAALVAMVVCVAIEGLGAHVVLYRWGRALANMQQAIYGLTPDRGTVIANTLNMGKFESPAYGLRTFLDRSETTVAQVTRMAPVHIALLDRSDSELRVADIEQSRRFLGEVRAHCEVRTLYDRQETSIERLHIYEVTHCGASPTVGIP